MKIKTYKRLFFMLLGLFFAGIVTLNASTQEDNLLWKPISGSWSVQKADNVSFAFQKTTREYPWDLNVPINYCSLGTLANFERYSSLQFQMNIISPKGPVSLLFFLAAEFSDKSYYHNLHAFEITGSDRELTKAIFIKSTIIDTSQMDKKGNFKVDELSSSECSIPLDQKLQCEIKVNRNTATLFINGKQIHTYRAADRLDHGIIGMGIKNSQLKLYDAKVYDGRKLLLHDDFSKDSIKVLKIIMRKVSKEEFERIKKEEDKKKKK